VEGSAATCRNAAAITSLVRRLPAFGDCERAALELLVALSGQAWDISGMIKRSARRLVARFALAIAVGMVATTPGIADEPSATPPPAIKVARRALVISIDGLRPDLLLRADTPNLHELLREGSFSFWARTTELSVTLPSHTSMLTGVVPKTHGILFNDDGPKGPVHPAVPTLLQLAKRAGYSTALVAAKSKFRVLAEDVTFSDYPLPRHEFADDETAVRAAAIILEHAPEIMFVHFGDVDSVGHSVGWATPEQLAAIHRADAAVGIVLAALKIKKLYESTVVIVTADHGGTGRWHGPNDPRARLIPWIAVGPGIKSDFDLSALRDLTINTEDTFATVCALLGIPVPAHVDGKPILQILLPAPAQTHRPDDFVVPSRTTAPAPGLR
jgi:hypothetical protein